MAILRKKLTLCLREILFGGVTLVCLAPNLAAATESPDTAVADTPAAATTGTNGATTELENVTVTAQSRTQQVQDVPIPLQIVTAKDIDKLAVTDLSKMNGYIPGLVVGGEQPTQPSYAMRGIGTGDFGVGSDSPIGVYVDGIYTGKTGGALMNFNDVQRIEVLKGPQGTLFGRNSAGGAISIITNEPSDKWEEQARVRLGDYGLRYIDGVLNAPINPDMALRFSFVNNQSDGWLKDAASGQRYEGQHDWGTRAAFRWNAPGNTQILLTWEHEKLDQPARPAIGLVTMPPAPGVPALGADPNTYLDPLKAPVYNTVIDDGERRRFDGVTLRIEHPFGWADFTSTTAWRNFDSYNRESDSGTNRIQTYFDTTNVESNTTWSQEFKLSGETSRANWVAGASFFKEKAEQSSQLNFFTDTIDTLLSNPNVLGFPLFGTVTQVYDSVGLPGVLGAPWQESIFNHGDYKAQALYGDVIWHLTDRLNLTTGVRFTHDEKEFSWYNPLRKAPGLDAAIAAATAAGLDPASALVATGFFTPDQAAQLVPILSNNIEFNTLASSAKPLALKNSWNDTSPRLVLDYKLTPELMIYASATKGYQAGGFNSVQVSSTYQPENVKNYEAGIKSYFPDYHLLLNASIYYYKFSNLQSLTLVQDVNNGLPLYLVTSSDQDAKGLELEAHWQATEGLRLNFTSAYIDARYKNFVDSNQIDLSGQPTGEPSFSAAAGLDYLWRNVAGGNIDFTLQHAHRGKSRCNSASPLQGNCLVTPSFKLGTAQERTDMRIAWNSENNIWGVALFANNLFDKRYVNGISNISTSTLGTPFASISPPRMYGVELSAKF